MTNKKLIFDIKVWISFLIGKRLSNLKQHIVNALIKIVITNQLLEEIKIDIVPTHFLSRDSKASFLLDLIEFSRADYLVTGDQDLLELNPFQTAQNLTPSEFEALLNFSTSSAKTDNFPNLAILKSKEIGKERNTLDEAIQQHQS